LIAAIYDCAVDPSRWTDTTERLRIELDFGSGSLSVFGMPFGAALLNIMTGIPPALLEGISPKYDQDVIEQWGGPQVVQNLPLGEPAVLSQLRDRSTWMNNRFYREWQRPQGLHDIMTIPLTRDASTISAFTWGRHESAGDIGTHEIAAARLL